MLYYYNVSSLYLKTSYVESLNPSKNVLIYALLRLPTDSKVRLPCGNLSDIADMVTRVGVGFPTRVFLEY